MWITMTTNFKDGQPREPYEVFFTKYNNLQKNKI